MSIRFWFARGPVGLFGGGFFCFAENIAVKLIELLWREASSDLMAAVGEKQAEFLHTIGRDLRRIFGDGRTELL